jgi:hypothetical protein
MSRGDRREAIFLDDGDRREFPRMLGETMREDGMAIKIPQRLRAQTSMSRQWIADRLRMGSASYVSNLLNSVDS